MGAREIHQGMNQRACYIGHRHPQYGELDESSTVHVLEKWCLAKSPRRKIVDRKFTWVWFKWHPPPPPQHHVPCPQRFLMAVRRGARQILPGGR